MNIQTSSGRFKTQVRSTGFSRKSVNPRLNAARPATKTGFEIPFKNLRGFVAFGISMLVWAGVSAPCVGQVNFDTIALSGLPAPGSNPGISYDFVRNPTGFSYDPSQGFSFESELAGPGASDAGIFSVVDGEPSLILKTGDPAPGFGDGFIIDSFEQVLDGKTAFTAIVDGPIGFMRALYTTDGGTPELVVSEVDVAVGVGPDVFIEHDTSLVEQPLIPTGESGDGTIAFFARFVGPGITPNNNTGLYIGDEDGVELVVRKGDAAPGAGSDVTFSEFFGGQLDQQNDLIFVSRLSEGSGLFSTAGGLHPIALEGTAAPGAPIGTNFESFDLTSFFGSVNALGQASFVVALTGDSEGIFSDAGGSLEAVAVKGDGYLNGLGRSFESFDEFVLNDAGTTVFAALVSGLFVSPLNDFGIYRGGGSVEQVERIVSEGATAPGIDGNVRISDFNAIHINNDGEIAFLGSLVGTDVDSSNDKALFAENNGSLQLIVREGDSFDVDDDAGTSSFRTISFIRLPPNRGYADQELTFRLIFTDGTSGIFTTTLSTTGDLNLDGLVGIADIDFYSGNLGLAAKGPLERLDLNGDRLITIADHDIFVTTLVETSNGRVGTFVGDINLDGKVDVLGDAFTLVSNLGSSSPFRISSYGRGDLNADQQVNVLGDAFLLIKNLGASNAD